MSALFRKLFRPLLFSFSPEKAHDLTFAALKGLQTIPGIKGVQRGLYRERATNLKVKLWDLEFPNPVGLAAGFDKDGKLFPALEPFGFGFIEVGTVTPRPQPGNPQPRLFRLPADQALINRMGFNNEGVDALVARLQKRRNRNLIIGGNIGKNKDTPNEKAVDDYRHSFEKLHPHVDYFVVNVSSPNTPDLRALQDKGPLQEILQTLKDCEKRFDRPKPILLKIAPDLNEAQLDDILEIVANTATDGLIATNTTIKREGLYTAASEVLTMGAGGLSGKPLRERATEVISYLHQKSGGKLPIIAVGGIFSAADAHEKLKAGASLVQLYTGFIYEGPGLVQRINQGLAQLNDWQKAV